MAFEPMRAWGRCVRRLCQGRQVGLLERNESEPLKAMDKRSHPRGVMKQVRAVSFVPFHA